MHIVIAGKNKCAIEAHKYLRNKYPKHEIIGVGNKDDHYKEDDWQPSYRKYLLDHKFWEYRLEDCYESISNMRFQKVLGDLEYPQKIKAVKKEGISINWKPFSSKLLKAPDKESSKEDRGTKHRRIRGEYIANDIRIGDRLSCSTFLQ